MDNFLLFFLNNIWSYLLIIMVIAFVVYLYGLLDNNIVTAGIGGSVLGFCMISFLIVSHLASDNQAPVAWIQRLPAAEKTMVRETILENHAPLNVMLFHDLQNDYRGQVNQQVNQRQQMFLAQKEMQELHS